MTSARVRQRLAGDDGMSLVELLVAMFVISVGLFALLSSFIASMQSALDQQMRSEATRIGTERLETLRSMDFDDVEVGTETDSTTFDGYTVVTEVAWMDASDGSPDNEQVKAVTVTITWEVRGQARESVFDTAISPLSTQVDSESIDPDPALTSVGASPDPVPTDENGHPVEDIQLDASVVGFESDPLIVASWESEGVPKSEQLDWGADKWRATADRGDFAWPGDDGEGNITITFTTTPENLTRTYDLTLLDPDADPPQITSTSVSPTVIRVKEKHSNHECTHSQHHCKNLDELTFSATVENFDPDNVDSVKVRYLRRDGSNGELALQQSESNPLDWQSTIPAEQVEFKVGSDQPFTFIATEVTDGVSVSTVLNVTVQEVKN